MRSFILSVSADALSSPIRNAVLAHAGYAVIPVQTADDAFRVLSSRYVSAMVIGPSIPQIHRRTLCAEGKKLGVPSVVLDRYEHVADPRSEIHVNPLDGPEVVLEAVASVLKGSC